MKQSEIRERVIFAIYDVRLYQQLNIDYDPPALLSAVFDEPYEELPLFARELFIKSLIAADEAEKAVSPLLKRWSFERLNALVQALFIACYTERNLLGATDRKVVIDEAVNFTKKFTDSQDYRYVNAVLDKVLI